MAHDTACDDGLITDSGTWLGFYRCNSCTSVYYSRELIIEVLEIFELLEDYFTDPNPGSLDISKKYESHSM